MNATVEELSVGGEFRVVDRESSGYGMMLLKKDRVAVFNHKS
jgi:hypothetical protein